MRGHESDPVRLDRFNPILHAIQQIRDEAHRFAITFHRQRRAKSTLRSELLLIPGIGESTVRKLLQEFGSIQGIREAHDEALTAAIGASRAEAVRTYFRGQAAAQAQQL